MQNDSDIHDRHGAQASPAASTAARSNEMSKDSDNERSKTTQAVRDAHYQEDGVKADGTVPGSVPSDQPANEAKGDE